MSDVPFVYLMILGGLLGVAGFYYLTFRSPWILLTIQVSAFVAVTAVLLIMAWIGYTLATTPPPMPMEDFEEPAEEEEKEENAQI